METKEVLIVCTRPRTEALVRITPTVAPAIVLQRLDRTEMTSI